MATNRRRGWKPGLHIYKAKDGWRWNLVANNGRILCDSGEAYSSASNATRGADKTSTELAVIMVAREKRLESKRASRRKPSLEEQEKDRWG
jgi:uncharacterized protein YegP (UPF0339 family)